MIANIGWCRSARYWLPAVWPLALGVVWIVLGARSGVGGLTLALIAGIGPLATGAAALAWGLDRMIVYHLALAGVIGVPAGLVGFVFFSPGVAIVLTLAAAGVFVIAGWAGLFLWQTTSESDEAPPLRLASHAAVDAALMGFYIHCATMPDHADFATHIDELERLETQVDQGDASSAIKGALAAPTEPETAKLQRAPVRGLDTEWLTFPSAYSPEPSIPGAERWNSYTDNQTVGCRLLRHSDGPRPWLICVHGYRMGSSFDMSAFHAERLHRQFGVNICMPILPLHGPRRQMRLTGSLFLDGPLANIWHAISQSLMDLRQVIAWLRATQSPTGVGVFGLSLGGYMASLLAAFEAELSPVIAAIPMVEIAPTLWQHMVYPSRTRMIQTGFDAERLNRILAPVSPLHHAPPATANRAIVAAHGDQVVPPEQPRALWHHWNEPSMHWADTGHLSIQWRASPRTFIDRFVGAM